MVDFEKKYFTLFEAATLAQAQLAEGRNAEKAHAVLTKGLEAAMEKPQAQGDEQWKQ
jgi:hypothetical protein